MCSKKKSRAKTSSSAKRVIEHGLEQSPLPKGTRVRTTRPNKRMRRHWTDEAWAGKKSGVLGTIMRHHDGHGLSYDVLHDDGSYGSYDPSEFELHLTGNEDSTSHEAKLYDLTTGNFPRERGATFRSLQVAQCWVCGALSNRVIMGGAWPMCGVRFVCPYSGMCWHHELEAKLRWLNKPHPQSYKEELQKEINVMKLLSGQHVVHDLEGDVNLEAPRRQMSHTFGHIPGSGCKHEYVP